jgi:shikimate dehydrogenase
MDGPTGSTTVVGVIGDPVRHSLSPAIHNAAFAALGLDWVYVAFPVPRGRGAAAVAAARDLGLAGLNVTMPHKEDVAAACDDLTPDAAALRSVNTVVSRPGGRMLGDSTDGPGFLAALAEEGIAVGGRRTLVLGAGGAARAVVLALGRAGASVVVAARRLEAAAAAALLAPSGRPVALEAVDGEVGGADLVVNATPLGMAGEGPPLDAARLRPGQVVVDLVYHPVETPLLAAARATGARTSNGLGMLVHQAARAFSLWTGAEAPLATMRQAAEAAIAARSVDLAGNSKAPSAH